MVEEKSEVTSQYKEELLRLTFNSKPIINNLTIIAEENVDTSAVIVRLIESRIEQAETDKKLPVIYLLDSIIKNVGGVYLQLFSKNIINTYCNTFEKVDTSNRISMVHLLKTWIGVLPQEQVSAIQDRISALVPSNPAPQPTNQPAIHVNPKYIQKGSNDKVGPPTAGAGRGSPLPLGAKGSKEAPRGGAPPARPTSTSGKSPAPAKGIMKAVPSAPSATPSLKNSAKPAAGAVGQPLKTTQTSPKTTKPAAPKPPTNIVEAPQASPERPSTSSMKKVPAPAGKGTKPAAIPGGRPTPPKTSPTKPATKGAETGATTAGARPPGVPAIGRGAAGVTGGASTTTGGAGRGVAPQPVNGRAMRPGEQKDPKPPPSGRGRGEHQPRLAENRDHPYRRPPSKFGTGIRDLSGQNTTNQSNPSEVQAQTNVVNSLLQLLGEQKGTQPNTPSDMYTPQPFNQFNQQQFQQFPQQFNNFGQNQPFPNQFQQQFPLLFNQSSFSQFPFNQQPFNNNQFPQSTSPQANAPLTPFMQPMANNGNRPGGMSSILGVQPVPTKPPFVPGQQFPKPFPTSQNPPFNALGAGGMGGMGGMNPMSAMGGIGGGMGVNMANIGGMTGGMGGPAKPLPPSVGGPSGSLADLKRQDRFIISRLYNDFALQCKICALRFNDSDRMAKHLDWHFTNNRKEKMRAKQAMSRPWYHTEEDWAESQGSEAVEKASMPFFESETEEVQVEAPEPSVVADETQPICPICHETFEQFWDSEAEEWMYRAAMISPMNELIVHQKCYNPDAPMTSPPVTPRAVSPMETTTATLPFTTTQPPTTHSDVIPPASSDTTSESTTVTPFSGVQGIDDLSF